MPTMNGSIGKRNTPTLTARLNKAIQLFTLRTDIPILATYAIRDVLREYLRDNTIIFCTRPPPWAGSKTALLEKILMENIGPVYFTEASPGKYNYLNPEDKKILGAALRNFMANVEIWQLKAKDKKRARIESHWGELKEAPEKN